MAADTPAEAARRGQCPSRLENGTCQRVNEALGWSAGMDLSTCNACWDAGPGTRRSGIVRAGFAEFIITAVSGRIDDHVPAVLAAMIERHLPPEQAEAALIRHAAKLGDDQALRLADILDSRP